MSDLGRRLDFLLDWLFLRDDRSYLLLFGRCCIAETAADGKATFSGFAGAHRVTCESKGALRTATASSPRVANSLIHGIVIARSAEVFIDGSKTNFCRHRAAVLALVDDVLASMFLAHFVTDTDSLVLTLRAEEVFFVALAHRVGTTVFRRQSTKNDLFTIVALKEDALLHRHG